MIFASDLDRTLFYSCKSFEEKAKKDGIEFEYIDVDINGLNKGIISSEALKLLKSFSESNYFIPITAREERHFVDRVRFEEFGIKFKYAVLGNGSKIYYEGKEDREWSDKVKNIKENIKLEEIHEKLIVLYGEDNVKLTSYGLEIRVSANKEDLINLVNGYKGFNVGNDHRFSYIFINDISKLEALKYIMKKIGIGKEDLICAGDSFMDIPMIKYAENKGILSLNGHLDLKDDIVLDSILKGVTIIGTKDVQTGTQILNKVKEFM